MPRRPTRLLAALAVTGAALSACGGGDRDEDRATRTATISFAGGNGSATDQTMAVEVPGFSAKLSVPGLSIGAENTDIDGIRFHPGSRLTTMNVTGKAGDGTGGEGHGTVEMRFADPAAPAAVLAYYRQAAQGAGWQAVPPAAGEQFAATKAGGERTERLGVSIAPEGAGSTGRMTVTGG